MELANARQHIQTALDRMRAAYLKPVFDEWAILALAPTGGGVVAYHGPRPEAFKRSLPDDAEPLRSASAGQQIAEGDIEFAPEAPNTRYDAFMKIGPTSFLVLNHTTRTMAEIRADDKWLRAQSLLFDLAEKFRADPLEL